MKQYVETASGAAEPDVARLVRLLGYITKRYDKDGVDFRCMNDTGHRVKNCKKSEELVSVLGKVRFRGKSNFNAVIRDELESYQKRLFSGGHAQGETSRRKSWLQRSTDPFVRKITFYIFTDGVWLSNLHYGQTAIKNAARKLKEEGYEKGQVGIQFIRFGDNEEGGQRLQHLDELDKRDDRML